MILSQETEGDFAYIDLTVRRENLTLYTVFVNFPFGEGDTETEEVDVRAATVTHAREIAEAALARDYVRDPRPEIAYVEARASVVIAEEESS